MNEQDLEFAHDVIAGDIEYCESEGFCGETTDEMAPDMSRSTLRAAGLSEDEIQEAFNTFSF